MIKIDDHTTEDLDALSLTHYNTLVGTLLADGINYHPKASLVGRIRKQKLLDSAIPNQTRVDFWDYLLNNNFANLKRVITSRPNGLKGIIGEIENICGAGFFSNDIDYTNATLTEFGRIVKDIFNYKLYRSKPVCRNNCLQFNLSYCPYCNEQVSQVITEVNGVTGESKRLALLQLDHFYPQSRHPYFSVSLFNLIPGCSPCNTQLKLEKKFDNASHFNPFEKRLDDYFEFQLDTIILSSMSDVSISYSNKQPHLDNALIDFRIKSRYENIAHKRVVFKLVQTFRHHSPKINRSIGQQIVGLFTATESKTKGLLEKYNVPINRTEINQVQLGKLKRDIAIQMGLLNN
jgi:hypothetical protein